MTQLRSNRACHAVPGRACCSGVGLAQARAMTTDWGRSAAGSHLWGTPETIHGESRLEYWKEMMTGLRVGVQPCLKPPRPSQLHQQQQHSPWGLLPFLAVTNDC